MRTGDRRDGHGYGRGRGPSTPSGRRRAGHARNAAPQQRPWAQPRMRYAPTEVISADELESIHLASLRVLSEIGMDFLDADAREVLRAAGASVTPDTQRVRFDPEMVTELIKTAPSRSRSTPATRSDDVQLGGDWMAFGTVGSPPNVADLDRGRRIGNRDDYQNLLRLAQSLNSIHFLSGYPVEPVDVHHGVRHLHATLRRADAHGQGDPLLQPGSPAQHRRPRDGPHRARRRRRDARSGAVGLHGRQLELAAAARRADAPGDHGVRAAQPGRVHHAVHAGRRDGAGDPRGRPLRAERRGAGRHGPDPGGQPGGAGHLRRLHLERRHAVGRAGVRDAGVHADRDDRRPAGASLRRAVSVVERVGGQCARRAGRVRIGVLAVGRDHGRGQPAHARGGLDGGRPPRQLREDDPRRRAAGDGRGVPRPGRRGRGHAGLRGDARRSGRAATSSAPSTRSLATRPRSTGRCSATGATTRRGRRPARRSCPSKANRIWKELLASYEPPPMDPAIAEELEAFVDRRVAEGGVPTDY